MGSLRLGKSTDVDRKNRPVKFLFAKEEAVRVFLNKVPSCRVVRVLHDHAAKLDLDDRISQGFVPALATTRAGEVRFK